VTTGRGNRPDSRSSSTASRTKLEALEGSLMGLIVTSV
jgi:hypothetical protein